MGLNTEEFYVGYLSAAPKRIARAIRRAVIALAALTAMVLTIVLVYQREFALSNFEYGTLTTIEGGLYQYPVPHIAVSFGVDVHGTKLIRHVLLVSPGKAGADQIVHQLQKKFALQDGDIVKLTGFLIYGDGKTLLQINEADNMTLIKRDDFFPPLVPTAVGTFNGVGEVVDPKCYFGVMKPGEGKAHRSCAIRCIDGGIPPVFHLKESSEYYLLFDQNGKPVNKNILRIIGDQISLSGEATIWGDWKILKINTDVIDQLAKLKWVNENLIAFEKGMTTCGNTKNLK